MSEFKLDISLSKSKFPELGLPGYTVDTKTANGNLGSNVIKGDVKADYESYVEAINRASGLVKSYSNQSTTFVMDSDIFSLSLDYEQGVPNTYKFLGMDINDDYEAVISVGDGYVIVANMFDADKIIDAKYSIGNTYYGRSFSREQIDATDDIIRSMNSATVRKLSTALKSGLIYEMISKITNDYSGELGVTDISTFEPLVNMFKAEIKGEGDTSGEAFSFRSILLNLINDSKKRDIEIHGDSNGEDGFATLTTIFLCKCFGYWKSVVEEYNRVHETLSMIDLWQQQQKKILGDKVFNARVQNCFSIISNTNGDIQPGIVAITGVARNGDVLDDDTVRSSCIAALDNLPSALLGNSSQDGTSLTDLLMGCINTEQFENPFELKPAELQAMSNYDGLQYSDEDVSVCMESYDMSNEDERALFLESTMKSYEKNFKEYKPKKDYDVTEAMAELIETEGKIKERIVSEDDYDGTDLSVYVVSDSGEQIQLKSNKKVFYKVAKLSNKVLTNILKLF